MATFWQQEEFQYFVQPRTKTSQPPPSRPPLHKMLPHDGEIRQLRQCKNIFNHDLFFEPSVNYAAKAGVGEVRVTIDSKEAARRYGGISIVDYPTKKRTAAADFRFRN